LNIVRIVSRARLELAIFLLLFITYSYFFQGGLWIQNGRFDQVRSIVEHHRLEINDYMIYRFVPDSGGKPKLSRLPLQSGVELEDIVLIANTGDVALFDGRVYPNKPPGAVFVAIPAYFVIYHAERLFGVDPDSWWTLTINAYLTTVFSVSLLVALGGMVFYRISFRLFPLAPAWTHAASTLTFGIGTLMLPFATMLYDHDIVAVLSLFSFWLLLTVKDGGVPLLRSAVLLLAAGVLAGLTMLTSYASIISVALLTLYATWAGRPLREIAFFLAGVALPVALLAWYQKFCFGSMLAIANTYQNEIFSDEAMPLFGMFGIPRFDVMIKLLFSSYRGLFFTSPVLILSFLGFWFMAIGHRRRAELFLCAAIFFGFLMMNSSFNNWHSGWSIGPRYLIPALPFLSLPLSLVFEKFPRTTSAIAIPSAIIMLLATAVDPQPPADVQNPLTQYILPLLRGEGFILHTFGDAIINGAVSANPMGVHESWFYPVFHPGIVQREWNSFNLGEFIGPGSLISLLPLLCIIGFGLALIGYWSRLEDRVPLIDRDEGNTIQA
jgi:hypothetical protein